VFGKKARKTRRPTAGDAKQSVFSYYSGGRAQKGRSSENDNSRSTPTYSRKRFWDRNWIRNLPTLLALGVITLSVLYCLGLSTQPKVVVSMSSPQAIVLRDKNEYQQGAQKILEGSVFNRTKFTINTGGFEKAFQAEFPEVADVSLALPLVSRTPIVTISTAQPQLLLTAQGKVFVLDKRGTVVMMANDLSSSVRATLPVVNDQSGLQVAVGKTVLPTEDIQFITSVLAQLKAKQIGVETITLPKAAHEVDMKIAGQPYSVKFSIDTNAREAAGSFLATKQKLEQTPPLPSQYIDVRVPGRAYYQ